MSFRKNPSLASLAGKRCAATVMKKLSTDWFHRMGLKGGATTKERHGSAHYRAAGKKGGETRWARERARQAEESL